MVRHKLTTAAIALAVILSGGAAALATHSVSHAQTHQVRATKYHNAPARLTAFTQDIFGCCVDMVTFDSTNTMEWVENVGGNVPYQTINSSASDFNEHQCVSAAGKDWCYWQDNLNDCMNVPTTGQWAFFIVASSCPANDTAEEWARIAVTGGWVLENRHTGQFMACEVDCGHPDRMIVQTGSGQVMNFPVS